MPNVSFKEVKRRCREGRFFSYEGVNDKIYSHISVFLVWIFVRLGFSGNAVSVLSGIIVMAGATLMASTDSFYVLIGSFGYVIFYLLDYVDGGVARFNGSSGIGGQYVDWSIHVIASVSYATGVFIGAIAVTGYWILPLGILTVVASALTLDRYALGWFTICMHRQQKLTLKSELEKVTVNNTLEKPSLIFLIFRKGVTLIFHENYIIYVLPALSIAQYFVSVVGIDFRVILILIGGLIYFPLIMVDILRLAKQGYIDRAYNKLFHETGKPDLPNDHFFG